jgi:hypothetical protein
MSRPDPQPMWEGPVTSDFDYTALVTLPGGHIARIDSQLEGLAAIASAVNAVAAALNREGVKE